MDEILLRDLSGVRTCMLMFRWYTFAKILSFHFIPNVPTESDADELSYQMCILKAVHWPISDVPDLQDY